MHDRDPNPLLPDDLRYSRIELRLEFGLELNWGLGKMKQFVALDVYIVERLSLGLEYIHFEAIKVDLLKFLRFHL